MAARTKNMTDRLVVVRGDLHAKLKRLAFENEIHLKELVNLMLRSTLEDTERVHEIIAELQA